MSSTPPIDPAPAQDAATAPPAEQRPPRPPASSAVLLLATLAMGFTLWAAQDVILPILLAMFFALIGNPVIRLLRRLYVPRFLASLLVLVAGIAGTGALAMQLVTPATAWVDQAPREARKLGRQLQELTRPMHEANRIAEDVARAAAGEAGTKVRVVHTRVDDPYASLARTPRLAVSVLAVVLLTFFFMVYGENLQRHAIALLPGRQQKKFTVEILHAIEREVSRYVLTISVINAVVGLAFACVLYVLDFPPQEALLWGTAVMLLNYAPYVGPLIGACLMLLVGFVAFDDTWYSLLPAAAYLVLHTLEGQLITPIVLGRRMALSPLVLILALMLFGGLWGMIGLLLAVPLLVCMKLVLAHVDGMHGWARLLE